MQVNGTQIIFQDEKHKEFVKFCNELRCPLCDSQLDGNIHRSMATLYCCQNNDEYRVTWKPEHAFPVEEMTTYWYPQYQYVIFWSYVPNFSKTVITRYNMGAAPQHRMKTAKHMFDCGVRVTAFSKRMEEKTFLHRLKTYMIFS